MVEVTQINIPFKLKASIGVQFVEPWFVRVCYEFKVYQKESSLNNRSDFLFANYKGSLYIYVLHCKSKNQIRILMLWQCSLLNWYSLKNLSLRNPKCFS